MEKLRQLLNDKKLLISDGAWGTQLVLRGLPFGSVPEMWNIENPDEVRATAQAYVDAGADIILTNTFGGSGIRLSRAGFAGDVIEINRIGAQLSRDAAGDDVLVFASIGPTGAFMRPLGIVSEADMIASFALQVQGFVAGGADGIVIETMSDLGEAKAALKAARDNSDLPVVVSMTFEEHKRGYSTMMGATPEQVAYELDAAGVDLIGANCGAGIEQVIGAVAALREHTRTPLWAKPNAGTPELVDGRTVFQATPEIMVQHLPMLAEAGAVVIGGCCGTTPEHIRLFALERYNLVCAGMAFLDNIDKWRQ